MADQERHEAYMKRRLREERELDEANQINTVKNIQSQLTKLETKLDSLVELLSVKCYGSTSVSKTEGLGSTPSTDANKKLDHWLEMQNSSLDHQGKQKPNFWRITNES